MPKLLICWSIKRKQSVIRFGLNQFRAVLTRVDQIVVVVPRRLVQAVVRRWWLVGRGPLVLPSLVVIVDVVVVVELWLDWRLSCRVGTSVAKHFLLVNTARNLLAISHENALVRWTHGVRSN